MHNEQTDDFEEEDDTHCNLNKEDTQLRRYAIKFYVRYQCANVFILKV